MLWAHEDAACQPAHWGRPRKSKAPATKRQREGDLVRMWAKRPRPTPSQPSLHLAEFAVAWALVCMALLRLDHTHDHDHAPCS